MHSYASGLKLVTYYKRDCYVLNWVGAKMGELALETIPESEVRKKVRLIQNMQNTKL